MWRGGRCALVGWDQGRGEEAKQLVCPPCRRVPARKPPAESGPCRLCSLSPPARPCPGQPIHHQGARCRAAAAGALTVLSTAVLKGARACPRCCLSSRLSCCSARSTMCTSRAAAASCGGRMHTHARSAWGNIYLGLAYAACLPGAAGSRWLGAGCQAPSRAGGGMPCGKQPPKKQGAEPARVSLRTQARCCRSGSPRRWSPRSDSHWRYRACAWCPRSPVPASDRRPASAARAAPLAAARPAARAQRPR